MTEAFALQSAQRAPQLLRLIAHDVRPEVAVRRVAVPLVAELLRQVEHDRDRQDVILARQLDQRLARLRLHVGGVDHRQLARASRFAAMKCSTSKASLVAAWSFSSSETRPRQKSEDRTSVGLKVLPREVDLPRAGGADQHHQRELGNRDLHRREDPHLRRRPDSAILLAHRQKAHGVAEALARSVRPSAGIPRASTRSGGRGGGTGPAGKRLELHVVLGVRRRQHDRVRAGELEQHPLEGRQPRRVEVLDRPPPRRRRRSPPAAGRGTSASRGSA